ncbi:DUF839 domain-containing protein [Conexibacter sp. W3-3-2]|nr:alkaline phosphatase PhoX [Conexibacter sp. W3-3-2]MTD42948.1 DUF839 domain-containing protein [Conexibacter sp. W3-3-2]
MQTVDDQTLVGKLTGDQTRRSFIKAVAAAGASTVAAQALEIAGVTDLMTDSALAAGDATPFSEFTALAASSLDRFEVPPGFRADVLIRYGDTFANTDGTSWTYGYNNDYLAYFPLDGENEGLIFVNHEYPAPFFQNGYKQTGVENPAGAPAAKHTKTDAEIHQEMESVGNSIVHIKRGADGIWKVVSPSRYNRRIFGGDVPGKPDTPLTFTGPLAGAPGTVLQAGSGGTVGTAGVRGPRIAVGTTAPGTIGNCSGGITPWGTALSCEENYDGYGFALGNQDFFYGWGQVAGNEYKADTGAVGESQRYGWVCEHDPHDPAFVGRKHTALGRFRHENTAFRQAPGKKFVLYMGDDQANQATYKFVSTRAFVPGDRANNLQILTEGTLYVARWAPEGRRRFSAINGPLLTATSGTGQWVKVEDWELYDTRLSLGGYTTSTAGTRRPKQGTTTGDTDPTSANYAGRFNRDIDTGGGVLANEWLTHFAMNRPEDVEVDSDGTVYIALTNNSGVNDVHGSVRRLTEAGNDPEALTFTWQDYASGGVTGRPAEGEKGFSSCDNLVFDSAHNLWIVTDISSASLRGSTNAAPPLRLPRQQRGLHDPAQRPERRDRVPLREHADRGGGHGPVLHARRADAVHQRPAPGRGHGDADLGGVRRRADLLVLVAGRGPHGELHAVHPDPGDRGDHAGAPAGARLPVHPAAEPDDPRGDPGDPRRAGQPDPGGHVAAGAHAAGAEEGQRRGLPPGGRAGDVRGQRAGDRADPAAREGRPAHADGRLADAEGQPGRVEHRDRAPVEHRQGGPAAAVAAERDARGPGDRPRRQRAHDEEEHADRLAAPVLTGGRPRRVAGATATGDGRRPARRRPSAAPVRTPGRPHPPAGSRPGRSRRDGGCAGAAGAGGSVPCGGP